MCERSTVCTPARVPQSDTDMWKRVTLEVTLQIPLLGKLIKRKGTKQQPTIGDESSACEHFAEHELHYSQDDAHHAADCGHAEEEAVLTETAQRHFMVFITLPVQRVSDKYL